MSRQPVHTSNEKCWAKDIIPPSDLNMKHIRCPKTSHQYFHSEMVTSCYGDAPSTYNVGVSVSFYKSAIITVPYTFLSARYYHLDFRFTVPPHRNFVFSESTYCSQKICIGHHALHIVCLWTICLRICLALALVRRHRNVTYIFSLHCEALFFGKVSCLH